MERTEYLLLKELSSEQERRPGVFPVFKKIHRVDGQMIGEVQGYSDSFGNSINVALPEKKYDH